MFWRIVAACAGSDGSSVAPLGPNQPAGLTSKVRFVLPSAEIVIEPSRFSLKSTAAVRSNGWPFRVPLISSEMFRAAMSARSARWDSIGALAAFSALIVSMRTEISVKVPVGIDVSKTGWMPDTRSAPESDTRNGPASISQASSSPWSWPGGSSLPPPPPPPWSSPPLPSFIPGAGGFAGGVVAHDAPDARFGSTRVHGSFGTGIREPSGFELAFTDNPRLKPERSVSFDLGVEQRAFGNRAVFDATYFYNRFEDQIVTLGGSLANLSSFTSDNLGNSRAQGMEFSFRLQPVRSVQLNGTYTLDATSILALEGTNVALSPFQVGQPLIRRPKNSGFFNATWTHRRLALNSAVYVRGATLDIEPNLGTFACVLGMPCFFSTHGYTRADGGFSYRLPRGLEFYGRLNNFLNQKYEESFGFPALHLNFLAGVKFTFPAE